MSQLLSKKTRAIILIILSIYSPLLFSISLQNVKSAGSDYLFNSNSSITYELNYTIEYESSSQHPSEFYIWVARINNWSTDQTSKIISQINPENPNVHTLDEYDIYNNSYDYFYKELEGSTGDQLFYLQYQYEITSTGNKYEIPDNLTIDNYDNTTFLYQYYTSYQPYVETNDTNIINTSLSVTDGMTSLNEMIEAIYLYIVENIEYTSMLYSIGAAETLSTKSGDCSEFSSLMVALLRTIGIPARKVLGYALVDGDISAQVPKFDVQVGDVWSYSLEDNNRPGHAWVQYYVPELGWISADPTWGSGLYSNGEEYSLKYLNEMDYLHLITSIGDYYGEGIDPALNLLGSTEEGIPEFPFFYPIGNSPSYTLSHTLDFKCIEVNLSEDPAIEIPDLFIIIGIGGGIFLLFTLIGVASIKKSKNNKKEYYR